MRKYVPAVAILAILLMCLAAFAAQSPKRAYWPGENPNGSRGNPSTDNIAGVVTALPAGLPGNIAVNTKVGPLAFGVTAQTVVRVWGQPATIAAVKVGDPVEVKFVVLQDGSRIAVGLAVPKPSVNGMIVAASNGSITLQTLEHTWFVSIGPNTKILCGGYQGSMADLHVGYTANAEGAISDHNVRADVIHFSPESFKGVVATVNGNVVTVETIKQEMVAVTVTNSTVIHVKPRTGPNYLGTLADIVPNTAINVSGHITGDIAVTALAVELLTSNVTPPSGGTGGTAGTSVNPSSRRR